jgi:hypothetical protein
LLEASVPEMLGSVFERFNDQATRVVALAGEEAKALGDSQIDTEHLLLGLLREQESIPATILAAQGLTIAALRTEVARVVVTRVNGKSGEMPFTSGAKEVLQGSLREALNAGLDQIGPEHILLALLNEPGGLALQAVRSLDGELPMIRNALAAAERLPEEWPRLRRLMFERTIRRADAWLLAARSAERVVAAIANAGSDDAARAAVARLLDVEDWIADSVIRQPMIKFAPARIKAIEAARSELLKRLDDS